MDYAATSPVKEEVLKAMMPCFSKKFGNPSSVHLFGRETRNAIDQSRDVVAKFLNCLSEEVIFNSGGTESDNMAIKGIAEAYRQSHIANLENDKPLAISDKPHIITSQFEHHAILDTCKDLEKRGMAEVTYLRPNAGGVVNVVDVEKSIKSNTTLISIMYVNNEIGTVQPIREIGKMIEAYRKSHIANRKNDKPYAISDKPYFHTDAVQAIEYFNCDTKYLHVDMLSLSAHKFGGPKGVGVFYVKKGTPLHKQNIGGAQEHNKRAGTENVAGIVGLGRAIELINPKHEIRLSSRARVEGNPKQIQNPNDKNSKRFENSNLENSKIVSNFDIRISDLTKLRDYFIDSVMKKITNVSLNGSKELRSPNNINLAFKHVEGESILLNLDLVGVAASSGSACTSGSLEPSHVLTAIGLPAEVAHGSIRFTIGDKTTKEEINYVVKNLVEIIKKLRVISPFK